MATQAAEILGYWIIDWEICATLKWQAYGTTDGRNRFNSFLAAA
jgi:hypothetical protein